MSLPNVTFTKIGGGLARRSPSKDHVSCLCFIGVPPSSWGTDEYKEVLSPDHAETLDLMPNSLTYGKHYHHISEFFRMAPTAKLYVAFCEDEGEISNIQRKLNGEIRQFAIDLTTISVIAQNTVIMNLQTQADLMLKRKSPASIIATFDYTLVQQISQYPDFVASYVDAPSVSVLIGHTSTGPGANFGTCLGTILGAIAKAAVNESILWVAKFDCSDPLTGQLQEPSFPDGTLVKDVDVNILEELDSKRYIFFRKYPMSPGTYFNNSHTCTPVSSDFAYIENQRTMDKAIREIYLKLLPSIGAPVFVDPVSGKLSPDMVSFFEDLANQALEQMERDKELSGYKVFVNPEQNILATGELVFVIKNVPVGVVRQMSVKISYTTKID